MKVKSTVSLILVVLLIVGWSYLAINGASIGKYDVLPFSEGIALGLDLRGGVYVVYQASIPQGEETEANLGSLMGGTIRKLQDRLTEKGFTEATVSQQGSDRIRVEIPDVQDPQEVLDILGTPGRLTFVGPDGEVILEGKHIKRAEAGYINGAEPIINFELTSEGTTLFAQATAKFVGQSIAIYLDERMLSNPTVNDVISGGQGYISGERSFEDAKNTAMLIQSGALPLDLAQLELRSISATLGEDAITTSLAAGALGMLCVIIFMIAVYRLPGLMASIALCLYLLIDLFLMAVLPGVQMTLPGIAGVILSIGMSVDNNVIIFERIKEELRAGKTVRSAVEGGFKNAFSAIVDTNITTLISAIVLGYFGTGSIKGFAITLGIGVFVTMFSAVIVVRFLLRRMVGLGVVNRWLYGVSNKETQEAKPRAKTLRVMRTFKPSLIILGLLLVAGLAAGIFGGGMNMGVDFTGGTMVTMHMPGDFDASQVEQMFADQGVPATIATTQEGTDQYALARIRQINDPEQEASLLANIEQQIDAAYPGAQIISTERVGAIAGNDLVRNAVLSVLIACALMMVYIWFRFELKSGVAAVVAIAATVAIMIAVVSITRTQINSPFIGAVLTIIGFSINNTIVIFDRIREDNRKISSREMTRSEVTNIAVSATITRTIYATLTSMITLVFLYFMGVESIKEFALPLIVGLIGGVLTSVFIAPPIWGWWMDKENGQKKLAGKKASMKPKKA